MNLKIMNKKPAINIAKINQLTILVNLSGTLFPDDLNFIDFSAIKTPAFSLCKVDLWRIS